MPRCRWEPELGEIGRCSHGNGFPSTRLSRLTTSKETNFSFSTGCFNLLLASCTARCNFVKGRTIQIKFIITANQRNTDSTLIHIWSNWIVLTVWPGISQSFQPSRHVEKAHVAAKPKLRLQHTHLFSMSLLHFIFTFCSCNCRYDNDQVMIHLTFK